MLTRKQRNQKRLAKQQESSLILKLRNDVGRTATGHLISREKEMRDLAAPVPKVQEENNTRNIPSINHEAVRVSNPWADADVFEVEVENFAEREAAAREEKERKKKRLAPLYNKGPVQYMTDDTDYTTVGRKV